MPTSGPGQGQLVHSYRAGILGAFQIGPQDVSHPDTVELAWVTRGRVGTVVDGRHHVVDETTFALIPPSVVHSSWTMEQETVVHGLHLHAHVVGSALSAGVYPRADAVGRAIDRLPAPLGDRALLERAAVELVRALREVSLTEAPTADPRLLRVAWWLAQHPSERVTVADLAKIAHLSPHHFSRLFTRELGMPPMEFVRRSRVERAAFLLRSSPASVAEIAHTVGFSSAGRLSEAFRAVHGATPSAFRAAHDPERIEQGA